MRRGSSVCASTGSCRFATASRGRTPGRREATSTSVSAGSPFRGSVYDPKLSYFAQAETSTLGNTNRVHLLDGWLQYQAASSLHIQAGRFLLPYSRQFYTHPGELLFADLSAADYAFNLPRSTGVHAWGRSGRLGYHIAATNSIRALDVTGERNAGSGVSKVARIDFDVLQPYGFLETSPRLAEKPQLSVGVALAANEAVDGSAFQNLMAGDKTKNVTVDAGFRWLRVSLQAAGYARSRERASAVDRGGYAQLGFYVVPRRWEIAARLSQVSFAPGGFDPRFRGGREHTIGINKYFYEHHFKIQADYTRTEQRRDPAPQPGTDHGFRIQGQLLF